MTNKSRTEEIIITDQNRKIIIGECLKNKTYELFYKGEIIERDITLQNLPIGAKLLLVKY